MPDHHNTLLFRLAGPMQSWGTQSRLQIRRTDSHPSKSGVLGLLLCAMGISRARSASALPALTALRMGVRIDRPGVLDWDYHTAGAGIGIRSAEGKLKKTESTGEYETLLSRRQYLFDASFVVALQGGPETISLCARALENPIWPLFLGRKTCIPSEPVIPMTGAFDGLPTALASVPWQRRPGERWTASVTLTTQIEHPVGAPPPEDARLVLDVPRVFGTHAHDPRWVSPGAVTVQTPASTGHTNETGWRNPYGGDWPALRAERLRVDNGLCIFCKSPAVDVHHVNYADVHIENLRSLCKMCHDACTMLEYDQGRGPVRTDPSDPARREDILAAIRLMLSERRPRRRLELLESARADGAPGGLP